MKLRLYRALIAALALYSTADSLRLETESDLEMAPASGQFTGPTGRLLSLAQKVRNDAMAVSQVSTSQTADALGAMTRSAPRTSVRSAN